MLAKFRDRVFCSAAVPAAFAGKMPALRAIRLSSYFLDASNWRVPSRDIGRFEPDFH